MIVYPYLPQRSMIEISFLLQSQWQQNYHEEMTIIVSEKQLSEDFAICDSRILLRWNSLEEKGGHLGGETAGHHSDGRSVLVGHETAEAGLREGSVGCGGADGIGEVLVVIPVFLLP